MFNRQYWELIWTFARRDVVGRYRGSFLGMIWSFLNPLALLLIYTWVFSVLLNVRFGNSSSPASYGLFFFCGMIPWLAFSEAVGKAPSLVWGNINLVKKAVFPLETLVISSTLSAWIHSLISLGILLAAIGVVESSFHATIPLILLVMIPQILLTLGVGWFLAGVGVFIRDTGEIVGLALRLGIYLTPIVYPLELVPERFRDWMLLNPLAVLVEAYRDVLLKGEMPDLVPLIFVSVLGGGFALLGYLWFMKSKKAFADVV